MTAPLRALALFAKRSSDSLEVSCYPHPETRAYLLKELDENSRLLSLKVSTVSQMADSPHVFPNLRQLELKGFVLTHFNFSDSPLIFLSLVGCAFISEHLHKLCRVKTITTLILDENKLTERGQQGLYQLLRSLPSLTNLSLQNVDFREGENMAKIVKCFTRLKDLNLTGSRFKEDSDDIVGSLTRLTQITRLTLADLDLQDSSLQSLGALINTSPALIGLDISENRFSMIAMAIFLRSLKHNTVLQELNLSKNESSQKSNRKLFEAMMSPIHLKKLNLKNVGLTCQQTIEDFVKLNPFLVLEVSKPPLPQGNKAFSLYMRRNGNTLFIECFLHYKARKALLDAINHSSHLTQLVVKTHQEMNDFDIPSRNLRFLTLKGFTLIHFSFTNLPLTYLSLTNCFFLSEHLGKLLALTHLVTLILDENEIDENGSHRLAIFLEHTKTLEYLSLRNVDFTLGNPLRIIRALPQSLNTFRFDKVALLREHERRSFISTLFKNTLLKKISISGMNLNDDRLNEISRFLPENRSLRSLVLSKNRFTLRAISHFVGLIKNIIELDLSSNGNGSKKSNTRIFEGFTSPLKLQRLHLKEVGSSDPVIVTRFKEAHPELHLEV